MMRRFLLPAVLVVCVTGCSTLSPGRIHAGRSAFDGITYAHLERSDPRPLQIHVLRIDLGRRHLTPVVDMAPDPDGGEPAETSLVPPMVHAGRENVIAAVNGNAWGMVPPPAKGQSPRYVAGGACDVCGWVLADGLQRSRPQAGYWSLWGDRSGRVRIGNVTEPAPDAVWAIAGFAGLLHAGQVLPPPSDVRHPRTAAGTDRDGNLLILAVVDGRQPAYSEGMSERELAELMLELGCYDALNLDGGGSSVMLLRDADGELRIVNRPSDKSGPRPIPVLFGVRPASKSNADESRGGRGTP